MVMMIEETKSRLAIVRLYTAAEALAIMDQIMKEQEAAAETDAKRRAAARWN